MYNRKRWISKYPIFSQISKYQGWWVMYQKKNHGKNRQISNIGKVQITKYQEIKVPMAKYHAKNS